jgi:hypothetical protein
MSRFFLVFWVVLHVIAFGMSIIQYKMKDNLDGAREMFGWSFGEALSSSLSSSQRLMSSDCERFSSSTP